MGYQLMERKIISGRVVERQVYWAPTHAVQRSKRKKGNTSISKQEGNLRQSVKRLARMINCNFSYGDVWLCLRYSEDHLPTDKEQAMHDFKLFIRRLERRFRKAGRELKYIAVCGEVDPDTGEVVRPHHHVIVPKVDFDTVAECWNGGDLHYDILRNMQDYTPLAKYMLGNVRRCKADERAYTCSRNMEKPIIGEAKPVKRKGAFRLPAGAVQCARETPDYDPTGQMEYIRYIMPEAETSGRRRE